MKKRNRKQVVASVRMEYCNIYEISLYTSPLTVSDIVKPEKAGRGRHGLDSVVGNEWAGLLPAFTLSWILSMLVLACNHIFLVYYIRYFLLKGMLLTG